MDMKETSAMTEASGLTNESGTERASGAGTSFEAKPGEARPASSASQDVAMRMADRLREVTVKAPLQALFAAFLLGVWVSRRR